MIHAEQSAVVLLRNPFQPSQREVMVAHPGQTIRQWLGAQGIAEFDQPTVCIKNGAPVLRADWAVTPIDGVVLFITLPQGGGGGGGSGEEEEGEGAAAGDDCIGVSTYRTPSL